MTSRTVAPSSAAWSHTRDQTFQTCRRRYYYQYILSAGGWRPESPPEVRGAYRLKHLVSLEQVLGTTIHNRAREIAAAIVEGQARPDLEVLRARTRAELNTAWKRGNDLAAFLRDPRRNPLLHTTYYDGETPPSLVALTRQRMEKCLTNLAGCPVWDALEADPERRVWITDRVQSFPIAGVTVWVSPDLVFSEPDGTVVIVDWKTGRVPNAVAMEQLCLYALFVRCSLMPSAPRLRGEVHGLCDGEHVVCHITAEDLEQAKERLVQSVAGIEACVEPRILSGEVTAAQFPRTSWTAQCHRCNFWELCGRGIRSEPDRLVPERPGEELDEEG